MKNIKTAGLLVLLVLAVSAFAVSAASASEFVYSKFGRITGKALNVQSFTLGKAKVECAKALASGEVKTIDFHELPLSVSYGSCSVPGIGNATVSTAQYNWLLPPALQFENAITIYSSGFGETCRIVIGGGQLLGSGAGEVEYENKSGKLVIKNHVGGIAYEVTESTSPTYCGQTGEKAETGSFTGKMEVEVEGAGNTIKVS